MIKEKYVQSKFNLIQGILDFSLRDQRLKNSMEFDIVSFLKEQELQNNFFNNKFITIEEILIRIYLCKEAEFNLIKEKELTKDHKFFSRILEVIELNPHHSKKIYEFCTFMYIENPKKVHSHWDFRSKIPKNEFDETIVKALYSSPQCFKIFIKNMAKEDLESIKIYSKSQISLPPMDLKTSVMRNILNSGGAHRTGQKNLLQMINSQLNIPNNYNLLLSHIDKASLNYYYLSKLEWEEFNNIITDYVFLGENEMTTVENIAKFNFMDKSLTEAVQDKTVYIKTGLSFAPKEFEGLVRYFHSDPFLKSKILRYMRDKASRAVKKENKTKWEYWALLLETEDRGSENPQSSGKTKRLKI